MAVTPARISLCRLTSDAEIVQAFFTPLYLMQGNSDCHGTKKGVSTIGVAVIAVLLVVAVVYGLYTFQSYSSSSIYGASQNTQVSSTCLNQATSTTTSTATLASTSSSSSCSVLKTLASKGQSLSSPFNTAVLFTANFNFTSNTTATHFTLVGSFTSKSNFSLSISDGSVLNLAPTRGSDGNYSLTLNESVPINPHSNAYLINIVSTYPGVPETPRVLVTSDFSIVTCSYAQLQSFYES